ncbi:hypothetical protein [Stutzerimonas azotifigens]|uniref:Uncharacterized protein n=1 Tax=Stutzerimonas azotifigens TaxID=291995 RepID=A0ABR5Z261_9GAMM|nr:hypothetical protein [Stutzerimonas azotifigens]MBA1274303.1 hypothetical protein [Stutzerimonas azotifigens]
MRIDGSSSSYPLDRPVRPGGAVTPYRESQRHAELQREQLPANSASQGLERIAQPRQVNAATDGATVDSDYFPARLAQPHFDPGDSDRPLSSRAAQALASYSSTASLSTDLDANEVLGLDLYA